MTIVSLKSCLWLTMGLTIQSVSLTFGLTIQLSAGCSSAERSFNTWFIASLLCWRDRKVSQALTKKLLKGVGWGFEALGGMHTRKLNLCEHEVFIHATSAYVSMRYTVYMKAQLMWAWDLHTCHLSLCEHEIYIPATSAYVRMRHTVYMQAQLVWAWDIHTCRLSLC